MQVLDLAIYMLKNLEAIAGSQVEMIDTINKQINQTKFIMIISTAVYIVISILVGYFVSKALVSPMKKLIKSAEKIASGENVEIEKNIKKNIILPKNKKIKNIVKEMAYKTKTYNMIRKIIK